MRHGGYPLRAVQAARDGVRVAEGNLVMAAQLGRAHAVAGDAREARAIAVQLDQAGGQDDRFAYEVALI